MKFIEVKYNDLKLGVKYIIINQLNQIEKEKIYIGIFNGFCNKHTINEISHWGKAYISYLTNYNKKYPIGDLSLNKYSFKRKYMILESQKEIIQNNMEARALKIILTSIIGDNNFCY
jgi:hypothetical protein